MMIDDHEERVTQHDKFTCTGCKNDFTIIQNFRLLLQEIFYYVCNKIFEWNKILDQSQKLMPLH